MTKQVGTIRSQVRWSSLVNYHIVLSEHTKALLETAGPAGKQVKLSGLDTGLSKSRCVVLVCTCCAGTGQGRQNCIPNDRKLDFFSIPFPTKRTN